MNSFKKLLAPYYPIFIISFVMLLCICISRILLILLNLNRIPNLLDFFHIILNGFRMDIVLICYISSIPALLIPFFEGYKKTHNFFAVFLSVWFSLWITALIFMETATPSFIAQYDVRPNRLFVEYLIYPKEVFGMLFKEYYVEIIIGSIITITAFYLSLKKCLKLFSKPSKTKFTQKLIALPLVALLIFAGARSSIGHRPANPASVSFSSDTLLNELGLNSLYSLLFAVYRMKDEGNPYKLYGKMDTDEIFRLVSQENFNGQKPKNNNQLSKYLNSSNKSGQKYNIVIILEESLGAEFVGKLGGKNLTPNLDKLSEKGLWFNNIYATGTRSVRGIEAVISGFPPTPGRSTVKLGKSQKNFFTIADFLSKQGYLTSFIYGGDSNFDNMKRFFLGNGFKQIIDEKDYKNPKFKSTWGVSDEDLFEKAHEYFLSKKDKPFFSLVFTSSNHSPFELPPVSPNIYPNKEKNVDNAVRYADYALGRFFEKAQKSQYWKNTVFLVVADHNSRVYGNEVIPVKRFQIPALILGANIKPQKITKTASQIDLPVTILSMAGISGDIPMPGHDFSSDHADFKGRAFLQFYKKFGYFLGDKMIILSPSKKAKQYLYKNNKLIPSDLDKILVGKAKALSLWTYRVYDKQLFRQP